MAKWENRVGVETGLETAADVILQILDNGDTDLGPRCATRGMRVLLALWDSSRLLLELLLLLFLVRKQSACSHGNQRNSFNDWWQVEFQYDGTWSRGAQAQAGCGMLHTFTCNAECKIVWVVNHLLDSSRHARNFWHLKVFHFLPIFNVPTSKIGVALLLRVMLCHSSVVRV